MRSGGGPRHSCRIRAVVLTLIFGSFAVSRPAIAEVQGDAVLGVVGADLDPQLGARAGIASESIGALVSADWTYVRNASLVDLVRYQDRFRALAHGVLPFELAPDISLVVRLGAGIELARGTERGTYPPRYPHMTTYDSDLGPTYEAAVGLFFDVGAFSWGGELGAAISMHDPYGLTEDESQRTDVFVRLVGRFAR